jgi:hypothetical protein
MRTITAIDPEARMRHPVHPGAFIRTEILEPLELTVTAAAQALGISRVALSNLLTAQAALSGTWRSGSRRPSGCRWRRWCGCSRPTTDDDLR